MSDEKMDLDGQEHGDSANAKGSKQGASKVFIAGRSAIPKGEKLDYDRSCYIMLHQGKLGWPCLSFDIIRDNLGDGRETFPMTLYGVAGTQGHTASNNSIITFKVSNLRKTQKLEEESSSSSSDDDDDDSDSDDEEDKYPKMTYSAIRHQGCVNRIRVTAFGNTMLASSWSELGSVSIWDLKDEIQRANYPSTINSKGSQREIKPLLEFIGHQYEGFALDWSQVVPGVLASGDCKKNIHIWHPTESGTWRVDQRPLATHTASVEDLQWSPNEANVLASCSIDGSIKVWDIRAAKSLTVEKAHESDVNVISWNRHEPFIISGGDDGFLHVWDLRLFKSNAKVASLKYHNDQICTVEWHPSDKTVFAAGGDDDQITLWDLAAEADEESNSEELKDIPPQLLFIHQGQSNIRELHWHPQLPGVVISTAQNGFNIFRTISV